MKTKELVYLDLFSGIGAFPLAFKKQGFKIKKHYYSEINIHAIANYKRNFKNSNYVGPIESILRTGIERPNIITFGSPCQDLSLAGTRLGFNGERSSLFYEAIELVRELKPDVFIWENVKGAFSSNNSEDFWEAIKMFAEIGNYRLEWELLNSDWLLPQSRERIFLIGHHSGKCEQQIFPITKSDIENFKKKRRKDPGAKEINVYNGSPRTGCNKKGGTGLLWKKNEAYTIDTKNRMVIEIDNNFRRFTEIELERLQGFPDNWTEKGFYNDREKIISETNRAALIGNSIPVDLIELIAKKLKDD